jgi:hypothetical protein
MGTALLDMLKELLKDKYTDEIKDAWVEGAFVSGRYNTTLQHSIFWRLLTCVPSWIVAARTCAILQSTKLFPMT